MKTVTSNLAWVVCVGLIPLFQTVGSLAEDKPIAFRYQPAPADNPLKGFVPFAGDNNESFPHSMEWASFPLNRLMDGMSSFSFDKGLEPKLNAIANRGHQVAMRVFMDNPGSPSGIPGFLINAGVKTRRYKEHGGGVSPDYSDERLIKALESFIAAFGKRYDGDPRLAYVTVGLLGFWGEWHTYPHEDWFAKPDVQNRILNAYSKAFKKTKLLMRYPMADGIKLPIGFHDDSFAHSTLPTIDWHFMAQINRTKTTERWRVAPIGGELRPEVQSFIWKRPLPTNQKYEDFDVCVKQTHCTWLINQHVFSNELPFRELERATEAAQSLGYELHVKAASLSKVGNRLGVSVMIENRGVAPIYYDWPVELHLSYGNRTHVIKNASWSLSKVQPAKSETFKFVFDRVVPRKDEYTVSVRIPNLLKKGKPVRFANQRGDKSGSLVLARFDNR
jgi:hypothetical protein